MLLAIAATLGTPETSLSLPGAASGNAVHFSTVESRGAEPPPGQVGTAGVNATILHDPVSFSVVLVMVVLGFIVVRRVRDRIRNRSEFHLT